MTDKVTLYHIVDGPVEILTCHKDDALKHDKEWSEKPWDKKQADEEPAAIQAGPDARRKSRKSDEAAA